MNDDAQVVVIGVMKKTRKRIKAHAATADLSMSEYVDSIVPVVPGDVNGTGL